MEVKRLNPGDCLKAMNEWINMFPQLPAVEGEYSVIRNDLVNLFSSVKNEVGEQGDYYVDEKFGIALYLYLERKSWFSLRLAADDGFWRYLSLVVVPDIVAVRWGKDNEDHYWKLSRRIWLKQIWWYIYLSWNENEKNTIKILESPNCSTDTILNFVERSGRKGTCVDAYRQIIKIYSSIPAEKLREFNRGRKAENLFRVIMKLNTARMMVMEPALCEGGCEGYALKLFRDAGITID